MARLLTGVTRARTVVRRGAPTTPTATSAASAGPAESAGCGGSVASVHDSVVATPRPGGGSGVGADVGPGAGFDVRNSWQVVAGSFLVPAGIVIILIAWYGAAHTRYVQQQIPYLVSGAFIGLGCMVLGGLLYWAHWLYRIYDQADLNHEEMMKAFEQALRVVADRATASGGPGAGTAAGPTPLAGAPAGVSATGGFSGTQSTAPAGAVPVGAGYVATATGSVYHVPGCPVVAHHGVGMRPLGPVELATMEPCGICLARRRQPSER